jgi:hypothetical protein
MGQEYAHINNFKHLGSFGSTHVTITLPVIRSKGENAIRKHTELGLKYPISMEKF